jgi:branched-chain amino acid transport system permease protein
MQPEVFLQLVFAGLSTGSIYALVALGLVLAFKGTGVLNFAQGEFVALGAYFALLLTLNTELAYPLVILFAILATGLAGVVLERALLRPLMNAPAFTIVIATLAIGLMIRNVLRISWQETVSNLPSPFVGEAWLIGGARINLQYIWIIASSLLLMLLLALFFRLTRTGKAMRAVAQNQTAARLMGVSVGGIFSLTFAISAGMGAIAGVLVAPLTGVEAQMGDVIIKAFVAAIVGGFYSLPGAVVGGLIIGLAEIFGGAFFGGTFKNLFAFALLIAVLLVRPNGLFGRAEVHRV